MQANDGDEGGGRNVHINKHRSQTHINSPSNA